MSPAYHHDLYLHKGWMVNDRDGRNKAPSRRPRGGSSHAKVKRPSAPAAPEETIPKAPQMNKMRPQKVAVMYNIAMFPGGQRA
ncbi:hypothetical protein EVAR_75080_1 [Eumeta japonica]|uniref:Uncharacterized protein n=1 Tax=Eumeta variegata TaxID=151549 RepID=A0A4C1W0N4_EUMVA|nr:hypothetical protein EVAR_75080_1 [Eumeta japonica]